MKDVRETLDRLTPEPARMSDWDAVLRDARPRRRSLILQLAVATAVASAAALFVAAPWNGSQRAGILERALAAVGDGPVVHAVFRGDWGGTLVDLRTGERKPLYGENEIWYDASRDLVHEVSRFGNVVQSEALYKPEKANSEVIAVTRQYRQALDSGTAHVASKGSVSRQAVYWVTIRRLMLPDVSDHRDHEFAEEVAVSAETYRPVAFRALRDRRAFDTQRIVKLETVDASEADLTMNPENSPEGRAMMQGSTPIPVETAPQILGATPLWLGSSYEGLPLAQTQEAFSRTGSLPAKTLVTGARAAKLKGCLRPVPRNRCPRTTGALAQQGDRIYEYGRSTLGPRRSGVTFFYGRLGENSATFKKDDLIPLWDEPHVAVTQTRYADLEVLGGGHGRYQPPEGSVVLEAGGQGFLVHDGLYVTVSASSRAEVVAAARALRPMPSGGSGAGG
jgi:hypothetical protein